MKKVFHADTNFNYHSSIKNYSRSPVFTKLVYLLSKPNGYHIQQGVTYNLSSVDDLSRYGCSL